MEHLYYMETDSHDARFNLAFEEYLLTHRQQNDYLLLWQNQNAVIIGRNQNTAGQIDNSYVSAHGIQVVRRTTGGGAVYHDLGNLNFSFITNASAEHQAAFFTNVVVDALRGLGLPACASGRNDILIGKYKVSGMAERVVGTRILHHGTLLFDSDLEVLSHALLPEPEKYRSKGIDSVRSRVGNIRPLLREDMSLDAFWDYLRQALGSAGMERIALLPEELTAVRELQAQKYNTWEWNYGKSPAYTMRGQGRFPGGSLEVLLSVQSGCISNITFYGDFLSRKDPKELGHLLQGCRCTREALRSALLATAPEDYLGAITADNVVDSLFG